MVGEITMPALSITRPPQPYPGLRAFTAEEWMIFFGREEIIDTIISRLDAQRMVFLHGASGAGKSSLVRAGILPRLTRLYGQRDESWLTCRMHPSAGPIWGLAEALAGLIGKAEDYTFIGTLVTQLGEPEAKLSSVAESLPGLADRKICLLVDQFEELFRYEREVSRDVAELFIQLLLRELPPATEGAAAPSPAGNFHIIVTMRSEFLGDCTRFDQFAEAINRVQYLVPRLSHAQLLRAIRTPAQLYGGEVTPALAQQLIQNMRGKTDELPLLQHALMLFWQNQCRSPETKTILGEGLLASAGSVAELVATHAESVFAVAAPDAAAQRLAARAFRALASLGVDGQVTRRPRTWSRLLALTGASEEALRKVLDPFRAQDVCFLTPDDSVALASHCVIDLNHEALTRVWKRLEDWINDEALAVQKYEELETQAARWRADRLGMPSRKMVDEWNDWWFSEAPTPAWTKAHSALPRPDEAQDLITDFIAAGKAYWEREKRVKKWRLRATISALGLILLLLLGAAFALWFLPRQANQNGDDAFFGNRNVTISYPNAWMWYNLSDKIWPNAYAEDMIGYMYQNGNGVTVDYNQAYAYFQKAVRRGSADAADNIGVLYGNGQLGASDTVIARAWYERAASMGSPWAADNLGWFSYNGYGNMPRNDAAALSWFRKALQLDSLMPNDRGLKGFVENRIGTIYDSPHDTKPDYKEALQWFRKAAADNDSDGANIVGWYYQYGLGTKQDCKQALLWYTKSKDMGNTAAEVNIGYFYENGLGVNKDYVRALSWYEKAGNNQNAAGANNAGNMYFNGIEIDQDYAKALNWYLTADGLGSSDADDSLGDIYRYGDGVPVDNGQALKWYNKAADAGNASGMFNVGLMYDYGVGVAQNEQTATQWYQKAAAAGNPTAQNNLGVNYLDGEGIKQDYSKALKWFHTSQQNGDSWAAFNLGTMYEAGKGVIADQKQAVYWYEIAATGGVPSAETSLAVHYLLGQGVGKSELEAIKWIMQANSSSAGDAEEQIGNDYRLGESGVPQDYHAARYWYQRGVEDRSGAAADRLASMDMLGQGAPANLPLAHAELAKATELYAADVNNYPQNVSLITAFNWDRILSGQPEQAEGALHQTFDLAPGDIWLEALEATALMVEGKTEPARQLYLQYEGLQDDGLGISWQANVTVYFTQLQKLGHHYPLIAEVQTDFTAYNAAQTAKAGLPPKATGGKLLSVGATKVSAGTKSPGAD